MDKGTEILVLISPVCQYTEQVLMNLPDSSSAVVCQPEFNTDEFIGWNAFHLVDVLQKAKNSITEVPVFAVYLGGPFTSQVLRHHFLNSSLFGSQNITNSTAQNMKQLIESKFQEFLQGLHEKSLNIKITC
jgi:hypothetical protein